MNASGKINGYTEEEAKTLVEYIRKGKKSDGVVCRVRRGTRQGAGKRAQLLLRADAFCRFGRAGDEAVGRERTQCGKNPRIYGRGDGRGIEKHSCGKEQGDFRAPRDFEHCER